MTESGDATDGTSTTGTMGTPHAQGPAPQWPAPHWPAPQAPPADGPSGSTAAYEPPGRRGLLSRKLSLRATVAVTLVAAVLLVIAITSALSQYRASTARRPLVTPAEVAGLTRHRSPELDRLAAATVQGAADRGTPGGVFATYGRQVDGLLLVTALPVPRAQGDAAREGFYEGLRSSGAQVLTTEPTVRVIASHRYTCDQLRMPGVDYPVWICSWTSDRSAGYVTDFSVSDVRTVADRAHAARVAVEA